MYYTIEQLIVALGKAEKARQTFRCSTPLKDQNGKTDRPLKVARDKMKPVAYGNHGSHFLQIDIETGSIRCGACEGDVDGTLHVTVKET